jgi:hypothetical protein
MIAKDQRIMPTLRYAAALILVLMLGLPLSALKAEDWLSKAQEHTIVLNDFAFGTGETLPAITMHGLTLGEPRRNAKGEIENAVMLLHGTGGDATSLLQPHFGDVMFGPGQLLDINQAILATAKAASPAMDCALHFHATTMMTWSAHNIAC